MCEILNNNLKARKEVLRIRIENAILGVVHIHSHLPFNLDKLKIKIKDLKKLIDEVNGCKNEGLIESYEFRLDIIDSELNELIAKDIYFIDFARYECFVEYAGKFLKRSGLIKRPQLQLIYFFLYYFHDQIFVDILRFVEKRHLDELVLTKKTSVYNEKKDELVDLTISSDLAIKLNNFLVKNHILNDVFGGPYQERLGQSKIDFNIIYNSDNFYRFINNDMKSICEKMSFPKLSCYSFQFKNV